MQPRDPDPKPMRLPKPANYGPIKMLSHGRIFVCKTGEVWDLRASPPTSLPLAASPAENEGIFDFGMELPGNRLLTHVACPLAQQGEFRTYDLASGRIIQQFPRTLPDDFLHVRGECYAQGCLLLMAARVFDDIVSLLISPETPDGMVRSSFRQFHISAHVACGNVVDIVRQITLFAARCSHSVPASSSISKSRFWNPPLTISWLSRIRPCW